MNTYGPPGNRLVILAIVLLSLSRGTAADTPVPGPVSPGDDAVELFNGRDFSGLYTFLKGRGIRREPDDVFGIQDGMIHVSGEGSGYIATQNAYRDYHLTVEYRWGSRDDGSGFVRNAGVLVHATGADGGHRSGVWMPSLEVQLAQGCEGDLIVIRGQGENGEAVTVDMKSEVRIAEDGKTRWQPGGERVPYSGEQFWWSQHAPFFEEKLDTRGKQDVASRLGEWTRVDVLCKGTTVTVQINGHTVNQALDVQPACGKILLQNEGSEIYYRHWRLSPVKK